MSTCLDAAATSQIMTSEPTPEPTPAPTPASTTFTGFVSIESDIAACAGGEYGLVTITVYGTTLCNATSVRALISEEYGNVYSDFTHNQTFYIARLSNVRHFQRNGSAQTGTPQAVCDFCQFLF